MIGRGICPVSVLTALLRRAGYLKVPGRTRGTIAPEGAAWNSL